MKRLLALTISAAILAGAATSPASAEARASIVAARGNCLLAGAGDRVNDPAFVGHVALHASTRLGMSPPMLDIDLRPAVPDTIA